jgi:hypothetical protein
MMMLQYIGARDTDRLAGPNYRRASGGAARALIGTAMITKAVTIRISYGYDIHSIIVPKPVCEKIQAGEAMKLQGQGVVGWSGGGNSRPLAIVARGLTLTTSGFRSDDEDFYFCFRSYAAG